MKRIILICTLLLTPCTLFLHPSSSAVFAQAPYLSNQPLPYMPVKLDVLFVGNSFSIDTSALLPDILSSLGINTVNVYVLYKGGCSMREHYEYFKSDKPVYEFYLYNSRGTTRLEKSITIREAMRRVPYDVVVFQQYSLESGNYSSYEPFLSRIIQGFRLVTTSPRTTFAFNQTWAYSSTNKQIGKTYPSQESMWRQIVQSIEKMRANSGIDLIIPCGTAIQNARAATTLQTKDEFTRDGQHLDEYMGRYVAACTFFETIIGPSLCRSIRDDLSIIGKSTDPNQVNNSNRRLLQNCARLAVANQHEVSEFAGE